jgi:menaquinone-dependent protoporphyrinogen IX oxidase
MMTEKKGLIAYETQYGSVADVAYWLKALIGIENHVDVKKYNQIIAVEPYDYVIIGGYTRWEKPHKTTYDFIERFHDELAKKELAYFLTCGEIDETLVMYMPGRPVHQTGGRSYFMDVLGKFPKLKPVTIGAFGGRQVNRYLNRWDSVTIRLLEKTAPPYKIGWTGLDMWESLVPERVEAFANDIRTKILSLPPQKDVANYRGFWKSLQPGNLTDKSKDKLSIRPWTATRSEKRGYSTRLRIKADIDKTASLLEDWAKQNGMELKEETKTFYNKYFIATKQYNGGKALSVHIVIAEVIEDPGNTHIALNCYAKPAIREGVEEDIKKAGVILQDDGRKID